MNSISEINFNQTEYWNIDHCIFINKIPVGYCKYDLHTGYLTWREVKTHKCIEKGCSKLVFNPNYPNYTKLKKQYTQKAQFGLLIKKQLENGEISQFKYEQLQKFDEEQKRSYVSNYENHKNQIQQSTFAIKETKKKKIKEPKKTTWWQNFKNQLKLKIQNIKKIRQTMGKRLSRRK